MPNRQLTAAERDELFAPLIKDVRDRLATLAAGDEALHWALRRKLYVRLTYDERGTPMQRRKLKNLKRVEQDNKCACCALPLPARDAVLDRREAMGGYTPENTRLICQDCDVKIQTERGFA